MGSGRFGVPDGVECEGLWEGVDCIVARVHEETGQALHEGTGASTIALVEGGIARASVGEEEDVDGTERAGEWLVEDRSKGAKRR